MEQRKMDYHLHTVHSMDGRQTVEELCRSMVERGIKEICLTEHIEPGHPTDGVDIPPIWDVWKREIQLMQLQYPLLTIRTGIEIGDNPPYRKEIQQLLRDQQFDFHLLSLHLVNGCDPYEHDTYFPGKTRRQAYREYVEAKLESVRWWDDFDSVAHIGYVAKYSIYQGDERPLRYEDAPDVFDELLRVIIAKDKCFEINTSGYGVLGAPIPDASIIRRYVELGGETFTFGSDSHDVDRNYADVERAKDYVRSLGGKYQASFCQRKKTLYRI